MAVCCPAAYLLCMTVMDSPGEDSADFRARSPWIGGDLQTLRNFLVGRAADLSAWPQRALVLPLDDGSGDALRAKLHREPGPERPLLVLIHGGNGSVPSSLTAFTNSVMCHRDQGLSMPAYRAASSSSAVRS